MARQTAEAEEARLSVTKLTGRELSILHYLARGLSDHEIAKKLYLSLNTIKWYNRKIFVKLGVCSRTQAIARGHELRIVDSDQPDDHEFT